MPIAAYFQTLKGLLLIRRAKSQADLQPTPAINHTNCSPGFLTSNGAMHGSPAQPTSPDHSPYHSSLGPPTPDRHTATAAGPALQAPPRPVSMHAQSQSVAPRPSQQSALAGLPFVVCCNTRKDVRCLRAGCAVRPNEDVHFPLKGAPAVPIDDLLPLLNDGQWRNQASCIPGVLHDVKLT